MESFGFSFVGVSERGLWGGVVGEVTFATDGVVFYLDGLSLSGS